jgi:predicted nucleic acid-binding protein
MTSAFSRGSARRYVLDANALIALFENRPGAAQKVRHLLDESVRLDLPLLMSAVNWGEVFHIAWRRHGEAKASEAEARLQEMPAAVIGVDRERASRAGALKQNTASVSPTLLPPNWLSSAAPGWSRPIPSFRRWEKR